MTLTEINDWISYQREQSFEISLGDSGLSMLKQYSIEVTLLTHLLEVYGVDYTGDLHTLLVKVHESGLKDTSILEEMASKYDIFDYDIADLEALCRLVFQKGQRDDTFQVQQVKIASKYNLTEFDTLEDLCDQIYSAGLKDTTKIDEIVSKYALSDYETGGLEELCRLVFQSGQKDDTIAQRCRMAAKYDIDEFDTLEDLCKQIYEEGVYDKTDDMLEKQRAIAFNHGINKFDTLEDLCKQIWKKGKEDGKITESK